MENAARIERIYDLLAKIRNPGRFRSTPGSYIEFRVAYALDGDLKTSRVTVVLTSDHVGVPPQELLQFCAENVTDPLRAVEVYLMDLGERLITIDVEGVIDS